MHCWENTRQTVRQANYNYYNYGYIIVVINPLCEYRSLQITYAAAKCFQSQTYRQLSKISTIQKC